MSRFALIKFVFSLIKIILKQCYLLIQKLLIESLLIKSLLNFTNFLQYYCAILLNYILQITSLSFILFILFKLLLILINILIIKLRQFVIIFNIS